VVNEVQHHQKFVDTSKKKTPACQQYEMMCEAYQQERDGECHVLTYITIMHNK